MKTATVREYPLILSAPMVRAVLEGTKTQTRRPVKPPPIKNRVWMMDERVTVDPGGTLWGPGPYLKVPFRHVEDDDDDCRARVFCPYGYPEDGARFWVRETWLEMCRDHRHDSRLPKDALITGFGCPRRNGCAYRAEVPPNDSDGERIRLEYGYKWRPSIHMPRWASRITLEVLAVRVERVQEITEADAAAEGVGREFWVCVSHPSGCPNYKIPLSHRGAFANLWAALYPKPERSWESNPWVWVLEFRRVTP